MSNLNVSYGINEVTENDFNRDFSWPTTTYGSSECLSSQEELINIKT